jgi:hypothetical protein
LISLIRVLETIFHFFILFLIGFGFSLLTKIPHVQRFLLRSRKTRAAGLLLLAMFPFLTGLVFTSRSHAEFSFDFGTVLARESLMEWMGYGTPDPFMAWAIPNKPSIINELWIESLYPTLSEGTCFSSDPMVCRFAEGTRFLREMLPVFYAMALIPAFISLGLGRRNLRRKIQLVAS